MRFIATVENRGRVNEIAQRLRELGCQIDSVLKLGGVIVGSTKFKSLNEIKIEGIKDVEEERAIKKI